VEVILDHPRIEVQLGTGYTSADRDKFDHSIWTGPLDAWFDYR
jgi:UDP-galactopyranose mutase